LSYAMSCPALAPPRGFLDKNGALVIDSMPPAMTTFAVLAMRASCAMIAACMPEPHILLMVVAWVDFATPAPSAAWRAGA